jgi:hypothetical protein
MTAGTFDGGPPTRLLRKIGLIRPEDPRIRYRVLLLICFAWLPLALLCGLEEVFVGDRALWFFLRDFGIHARFLVAAPLLVIGDSWCLTRLSRSASYLRSAGIVRTEDRNVLEGHLASTCKGLNSIWAEVLGLVLTYSIVFALFGAVFHPADLPKWHIHWSNGEPVYSAAGYWHLLVSMPLLILQLFGWVWRHLMWWRLLRLTSKLPLRLIAAHPDRSGGLKFMSTVLRGYWPLCFALGVIIAGRAANQIQAGLTLYDCRFTIAGLLAFLLTFILMPLTVFIPVLIRLSGQGAFSYGSLASAVGERFETKWLKNPEPIPPSALEAPDFSATIDLYSVVTNAQQILFFPARFAAICELIVVTLIPFVPVALASLPLDTILTSLGKILF